MSANERPKAKINKRKSRLLQTDYHIGIVGSGLAGLSAALAILLRARSDDGRRGENVTPAIHEQRPSFLPFQGRITIYERDGHPHERKEGYGMTLTYDPAGPLAKLGVLEEVARRDCPSRCHYVFREGGEVEGYFGNAFYSEGGSEGGGVVSSDGDLVGMGATPNTCRRGTGQRGNLRIPRSELRSILMDALMSQASIDTDEESKMKTADSVGGCSPRVRILWKKRLRSYVDRPMMEKLSRARNHNGKKNTPKNKEQQRCNHLNASGNARPVQQQQSQQQQRQHQQQQQLRPVLLHFEDGTTDQVDLLVGADGVNSTVAKQYLSTTMCSTLVLSKESTTRDRCDGGNVHNTHGRNDVHIIDVTESSAASVVGNNIPKIQSLTSEASNHLNNDKHVQSSAELAPMPSITSSPIHPCSTNNQPIFTQGTAEEDTASSLVAPQYLGIFIILGISEYFHPLIDERGFYTLDGNHRLFIMPFSGSRLDDELSVTSQQSSASTGLDQTWMKKRRTMWQLSFPVSNKTEARRLSLFSSSELQKEVLKRCYHWHAPFPDMVQSTPLATIWGTSLLDRDPNLFLKHRTSLEVHGRLPSRVVVVGDAAHSMTPFKGQGANQALADGPLLVKWLSSSNPEAAVRGFMTEMARRSGAKVAASREAARRLHSDCCWNFMFQQNDRSRHVGQVGRGNDDDCGNNSGKDVVTPVFHGIQTQQVSTLLHILKERGIGASLGSKLDKAISGIVRELNIADILPSSTDIGQNQISSQEMDALRAQALEWSSTGNTGSLRQLSQKSTSIICNSCDDNKRTCLHHAAENGHVELCRWLLSEANISFDTLDRSGKTPLQLAVDAGNEETVCLLKRWINQEMGHSYKNAVSAFSVTNSFKTMGTAADKTNLSNVGVENDDAYGAVEQQLRGIKTEKQLHMLLQSNCHASDCPNVRITNVLGCPWNDKERDRHCMQVLAEEHGAVLLRNFVSREVDQLALGALALRPMDFDLPSALDILRASINDESFNGISTIGFTDHMCKSEKKKIRKRIEETKSQMTVPADADIIIQTNFGPQLQSYNANVDQSKNATKKRKMDSFPLSRLRYINLGKWNYNWGKRRYEEVKHALALPDELVSLAQRAHELALRQIRGDVVTAAAPPVPFDMAICNLYHLQRPSDRLGGHQDNVESNLSLPLVSLSLGVPGIFLLGGNSRKDIPTAILIRAGDCIVMSGRSRGYFHGIPTILSQPEAGGCCGVAAAPAEKAMVLFPSLTNDGTLKENAGAKKDIDSIPHLPSLDELKFMKAFLATVRMNISIRQI